MPIRSGLQSKFNRVDQDGTRLIAPTPQENDQNPEANLESFDAIYYAALQVVIVSSANGVRSTTFPVCSRHLHSLQWSGLMYQMMDSEFFVSCFFYIVCIIVLNFWLINLFVAVITNTFSAIRSDTKKSAFGAAPYVIDVPIVMLS